MNALFNVTQTAGLPYRRPLACRADWQSAIQQTGGLRYVASVLLPMSAMNTTIQFYGISEAGSEPAVGSRPNSQARRLRCVTKGEL